MGLQVLVAEDNPINAKVIQAMIVKLGCQVTLVSNGRQAVSRFQDWGADCVFLDLHMPELDGLSAVRLMRAWEVEQRRVAVPIVALTAEAFPETEQLCREGGFSTFLTKPVRFERVGRALAEAAAERAKD